MSKIRLALVTESTVGGIKRHVLNIVQYLDRNLFHPTVLFPGKPRMGQEKEMDFIEELRELEIPFRLIPMVRQISFLKDLRSFFALKNALAQPSFDVVHAHGAKAGFLVRLLYRLDSGIPCYFSPHGFAFQKASGFRSPLYLSLERMAASWCTGLIVNSTAESDCALKHQLARAEKLTVVANALPLPVFVQPGSRMRMRNSLGTSEDRTVFLTMGRLVFYKNHHLVVKALKEIIAAGHPAELWIAGEGEQRAELETLAGSLRIEEFVHFLGYRKDIYEVLSGCDCFVLASQTEASPYSILEALAMERPILATSIPGNLAFLNLVHPCRVFPPNDAPAVVQAMMDFVRHPFSAPQVQALPPEWFDVRSQVGRLEQIYLEAVKRRECVSVGVSQAEGTGRR